MEIYLFIGILIIPGLAHLYLMMTYSRFNKSATNHNKTGYDVAREILDRNGLNDLYIVETNGTLSDHYDPIRKTVRLSNEIYRGKTAAALAVAAHEVGHAIQDKEGYAFMRFRSKIFPIVRIGTGLSYYLVFGALIFEMLDLALLGVGLMVLGLIFQLITLPVEFDASKKAKKELANIFITDDNTNDGISKMLTAAALTYVAGVLTSAMNIIRLLLVINSRRD